MPDVEELVRLAVEAYNKKDIGALVALYANHAEVVSPNRGLTKRRAASTNAWEDEFTAFPDATGSLESEAIRDQTVFAEYVVTGTNTGPLTMPDGSSVPATGKGMSMRGAAVADVRGGLITSQRFLLGQDVAPRPAQARPRHCQRLTSSSVPWPERWPGLVKTAWRLKAAQLSVIE